MVAYADTSFLFPLYAQDANTARAAALGGTLQGALSVTPLQRFEMRNALRLAVFRGDIAENKCRHLLELIEADTKTGVLADVPVAWVEAYAAAEALSAAHTGQLGTRAVDVLHVAAAVALGATHFLSFDTRQKALASKVGMKVLP